MNNHESDPIDKTQITGVFIHSEIGWAVKYSDNTCRPLRQSPTVIVDRIEKLDRPEVVKRRSHKLAIAAATLIIAEGVITGTSIAQNQGDVTEGLDDSANIQIGAFFDSIDALEDFLK